MATLESSGMNVAYKNMWVNPKKRGKSFIISYTVHSNFLYEYPTNGLTKRNDHSPHHTLNCTSGLQGFRALFSYKYERPK